MTASHVTAVVEDPRYRDHRGPDGHPERPDRLLAVGAEIEARAPRLERLAPREASPDELLRVHGREHLERVAEAARRAPAQLDPDTFVSPESFAIARLAAGGSVELARQVARGEVRNGLAAVRPPGHHAEAGRAMGFCLFNNVAVAACALREEEGLERIVVLDWDVHHGNGTQHFFEEDPGVFYVSTHQFPYYPGTGDFGEIGRGKGEGATFNVPLPAGCGDAEYVGVFQRLVVPALRAYRPEMILVSCGFDAHADDPLAGMRVGARGFRAMSRIVRALAEDLCQGRLVLVLEGGYALTGLREGTASALDALLEEAPPSPPPAPELEANSLLSQVVTRVVAVHGGRIPSLGAA